MDAPWERATAPSDPTDPPLRGKGSVWGEKEAPAGQTAQKCDTVRCAKGRPFAESLIAAATECRADLFSFVGYKWGSGLDRAGSG